MAVLSMKTLRTEFKKSSFESLNKNGFASGFAPELILFAATFIVISRRSGNQNVYLGWCSNYQSKSDKVEPFLIFVSASSTQGFWEVLDTCANAIKSRISAAPTNEVIEITSKPEAVIWPSFNEDCNNTIQGTPFANCPQIYFRGNSWIELSFNENNVAAEDSFLVELEQIKLILQGVFENSNAAVGSLSMVTSLFREALPNPEQVLDYPDYGTAPMLVYQRIKENPDAVAITTEDSNYTYFELGQASDRIVELLTNAGLSEKHVVAVTGDKNFGLIVSILAVLKSGAILLNLDPSIPEKRRDVMLEQAGAKLILSSFLGKSSVQNGSSLNIKQLKIDPQTGRLELNSEIQDLGKLPIKGLPSDAAYIFFTSGTTGTPKAILGSHKGLGHFLTWQREKFKIGQGDRSAQLTGISFDVVLRDIFLPLTSGATLCIPPNDLNIDRVLPWIEENRISILHSVPTLIEAWLSLLSSKCTMVSLKYVFFAGEPLKATLIQKWRETFESASTNLVNFYGPTETTLAKFYYPIPLHVTPGVQPVGWPQPHVQALILNEHGGLCGIGELGEIVIRTRFMSHGYLNASSEQADKFIQNPFLNNPIDRCYKTGDMGRYRKDGAVEICGRKDFQIKISGRRIELGEIEVAFLRHSSIRQCVVVAYEMKNGNKQLVGFVIAKDPSKVIKIDEFKNWLLNELPDYMVPSEIITLASIPLTPNGKVDRPKLEQIFQGRTPAIEAPLADIDPITKQLGELWKEVLGITPKANDNFFQQGGNSIAGMRLVALIRRVFKIEIKTITIFQYPTFISLQRYIREEFQKLRIDSIQTSSQFSSDSSGPLTDSQEFYFLTAEPRISRRRTTRIIELNGNLDIQLLNTALIFALNRHQALLCYFEQHGSAWRQRLSNCSTDVLEVIDLDLLKSDEEKKSAYDDYLRKVEAETYDLTCSPLYRFSLVKRSKDLQTLALRASHVILDGFSMQIFVADLFKIYTLLVKKLDSDLEVLSKSKAVSYLEFAKWQYNQRVLSDDVQRKEFWIERVVLSETLIGKQELPKHYGYETLFIPTKLLENLKILCMDGASTEFEVFLAIVANNLLRHFNKASMVVNLLHHGRLLTEFENVVGAFNLMVPLKVGGSSDRLTLDFLQRVKDELINCNDRLYFPIHRLATRGINTFYNIVVNFNYSSAPIELDGIKILESKTIEDTLKSRDHDHNMDLGIICNSSSDGLSLRIFSRRGLLSPSEVRTLIRCIQQDLLHSKLFNN